MHNNDVKTGNNGLIEVHWTGMLLWPCLLLQWTGSMLLPACSISSVALIVWIQGIYCNPPPCGRHTNQPGLAGPMGPSSARGAIHNAPHALFVSQSQFPPPSPASRHDQRFQMQTGDIPLPKCRAETWPIECTSRPGYSAHNKCPFWGHKWPEGDKTCHRSDAVGNWNYHCCQEIHAKGQLQNPSPSRFLIWSTLFKLTRLSHWPPAGPN